MNLATVVADCVDRVPALREDDTRASSEHPYIDVLFVSAYGLWRISDRSIRFLLGFDYLPAELRNRLFLACTIFA